jgi:hypothetical protein
MEFKLALSDQLYTWSDSYENKINFSTAAKKKNADKKTASFRSRFAGIFNRALQALWQAGMQVRPIAGAWSEILSVGQQTQTETGDGLHPLGLQSASRRIYRKFSPHKNDSGRALRNQPRADKAAGKTLARPPPYLRRSLKMATDCFDIQELAILLANMLENAMQCDDVQLWTAEVEDEQQDSKIPSAETSLYLSAPIKHESGPAQPGKHRAPVCPEGQSHRTGMAGELDSYPGWGLGSIGFTCSLAQGFPEFGRLGLNEQGRCGLCAGSVQTVPIMHRLAPLVGTLRFHEHIDHRRGWMLQSVGLQRSITIRPQRNYVPSRVTFSSRAPPRREVEQS